MATTTKPTHAEQRSLTFQYRVSPEWIEQERLRTGTDLSETFEISLPLADLPATDRKRMLELDEKLCRRIRDFRSDTGSEWTPTLREPTDDITAVIVAWERKLDERERDLVIEERRRHEACAEAEIAHARMREERNQRMWSWIAANGSEHLRTAGESHEVTGLYVRERVAVELPEFNPTRPSGGLRERANPSEAAMRLLRRTQTRIAELELGASAVIVWLKPGDGDRDPELVGELVKVRYERSQAPLDGYELLAPVDLNRQLARFTSRLSRLVDLGHADFVEAMELLASEEPVSRMRAIILALRDRMGSKEPCGLSEALADHPDVFSPYYRKVIELGEEDGSLHSALAGLAQDISGR